MLSPVLSDKTLNGNSFFCHSDVMEENMRVSLRLSLSLALGLVLAIPAAALGSPTSHPYKRPHHATVVYPAPPAPGLASAPSLGFWTPSYTPSHQQYEVEGLTRNMDDCAKYGCIGNN